MDTYDLQIYKGQTFSLSLTLRDSVGNPLDLSNKVVSGFLKNRYGDAAKIADLNPTIINISGSITLGMTASITAALPVNIAVYDIEMLDTGNGVVTKILRGNGFIYPEATY